MIYTSDPDNVDPKDVYDALDAAGYFVLSVDVNYGERTYAPSDFNEGRRERGLPEPDGTYGACGVEGCKRCRPLFDADNNVIPDTDDN